MLAFAPERLGHAVSAVSDVALLPALLACGAPVELCLTSNVLSRSVPSYGCAPARCAQLARARTAHLCWVLTLLRRSMCTPAAPQGAPLW